MTSACTAIMAKYQTPLVIHSNANLWLFVPVFFWQVLYHTRFTLV